MRGRNALATLSADRCGVGKHKLLALLTMNLFTGPLVAQAEPFAYVTNAFAPSVSVVDTATNQITTTIAFPAGSIPFAAAITPDLRKVYVTSLDAFSACGANTAVFVIDTASNTLGASPIAVGCEPTGIAITPDGERAYVASQLSDSISVIDTASDAVSATIALPNGGGAAGIAISPDGLRAYVTVLGQSPVLVIDTSSNTVIATPIDAGSNPAGIATNPNGQRVYVTNNLSSGSVTVIDTATNTAVATIPVGSFPSAIAVTPEGTRMYVTNGGINGGIFTVSVIDTESEAVVGDPIPVGSFPNSVAINLDGTQVYVGDEGSNTVTVIDRDSNTVTATLGGMNSPRGVAARPIPSVYQVPNVIGQGELSATIAVIDSRLTVGRVTHQSSSTVASGIVISQNPSAGTFVGRGAEVDLVISSGDSGGGGNGGGGGSTTLDWVALFALLNALVASRHRRRAPKVSEASKRYLP